MPEFDIVQTEDGDLVIEGDPAQAPLGELVVEHEDLTVQPTGGSTMPQLDATTFSSQIFWLVITFLFLWLVLSRKLIPEIHTVLENRQTKIRHDLDRAEKLRSEAESAKENYERALKESRTKAQTLIAESTSLMEKSASARHAELDTKLEKQLSDAQANIEASKAQALARLAPVSKELTQAIVEKLTAKKIAISDVSAVVDAKLKEKHNA